MDEQTQVGLVTASWTLRFLVISRTDWGDQAGSRAIFDEILRIFLANFKNGEFYNFLADSKKLSRNQY